MPEITTSLYPAATSSLTWRTASFKSKDRLCPRVNGMMQNEQRLLQPSCTLRLGRVFSECVLASNTGAASNSVCAKMSETKMDSEALTKLLTGTNPAGATTSATLFLCEFPTTHV